MLMSPEDHRLVATAIRAAEERTDGEIYAVIARRSDSYFAPAAFAVSVAAVLAGLLLAHGLKRYWWDVDAATFMTAFAFGYGAAILLIAMAPGIRLLLVPRRTLYRRAHQNALGQFLARNIHVTKARTGVLLFVSVCERYAEVVADDAINLKVDQAHWDRIVAMLIDGARRGAFADGYVKAVEASGALLASHFPKTTGDRNELDDHLVEL